MATINLCVSETMQDYGKCHTEEHKVNLLLTNCNQTLKPFIYTLIQYTVCFLNIMGVQKEGNASSDSTYDKGFSIAIQAKRYKNFF